jgi:hypothetical protein
VAADHTRALRHVCPMTSSWAAVLVARQRGEKNHNTHHHWQQTAMVEAPLVRHRYPPRHLVLGLMVEEELMEVVGMILVVVAP